MARFVLIAVLGVAGCARPQLEQTSLSPGTVASAPRSPSVSESLHRLMETPSAQQPGIPEEQETAIETISIIAPEDLASDGRRYSLCIDRASSRAWLRVTGGLADHIHETSGPWPLSNPDVRMLMQRFAGDP